MSNLLVVGAGMDMVMVAVDPQSALKNRFLSIAMHRYPCPASICPTFPSDSLNKHMSLEYFFVLPVYCLDRSHGTVGANVSNSEVLVQNVVVRFKLEADLLLSTV
jgi:hypothetical protein